MKIFSPETPCRSGQRRAISWDLPKETSHRAGCRVCGAVGACSPSSGEDAKSSPEIPAKPQQALLKQEVKSTSLNKAHGFALTPALYNGIKGRRWRWVPGVSGATRLNCPAAAGVAVVFCQVVWLIYRQWRLLLYPPCSQPRLPTPQPLPKDNISLAFSVALGYIFVFRFPFLLFLQGNSRVGHSGQDLVSH